jgi:hypothetical protein
MSRVSLIEQLYAKRKSALEFNYDSLWAPPIRCLLSQQDIDGLYQIATSLRYNANINKKYELIDAIMRPRGFRRGNCGTNRVVYNFLEDPTFVAKIALDKVGLKDSPAEFKNQRFLQPFCCKIFEVDPTGVISFIEKVNPITSLEEFASVADDIFNMMITKIIGKYVVDDLGTTKFMNYGLRQNANGCTFGPVVIDFPYVYELDGGKLICAKPIKDAFGKEHICGGEIDYDAGLNNLYCTKCGRSYTAQDLAKEDTKVLIMYGDESVKGALSKMRAQIVTKDGTVIKDSGRSSRTYVSQEDYENMNAITGVTTEPREVEKTIRRKTKPIKQLRKDYFNELHQQLYESIKDKERFNPVIDTVIATDAVSRRDRRPVTYEEYVSCNGSNSTVIVTEAVDASVVTTENAPEDIAQVDNLDWNMQNMAFDPKPVESYLETDVEPTPVVNEEDTDPVETVDTPELDNNPVDESATITDLGEPESEIPDDKVEDISEQFGHDVAEFIMNNLKSNSSVDNEPDYSNYEPSEEPPAEEEPEENNPYDEYGEDDVYEEPRKHRRLDDDMSDY